MFKVGERICALLIDVDPQLERFALSTADLEEERGEMLYNKDGVMRNAPAMVIAFFQRSLFTSVCACHRQHVCSRS